MTLSLRKNSALGPTRLMAAWIILAGTIAGIGVAAIIMPSRKPAQNAVWIDVPPESDRYAATDQSERKKVPYLNERTAAALLPEVESMAEADKSTSDAPVLNLRRVDSAQVPMLALTPPTPSVGVEDVVITLSGTRIEGDGVATTSAGPGAPNPTLMAASSGGMRPAIGANGRTPFDEYRRHDRRLPSSPKASVAIMVSGLGLDPDLTNRAIDMLPPEVTLSFAPYTRDLIAVLARATADGHEVVLEIPMEQGGANAQALGTAGLMTFHSAEANAKRLDWILTRAPAYPMVTNYLGRTFSNDEAAIGRMLETLSASGLAYLDDTGLVGPIANRVGVAYSAVSTTIPPGTADVEAILRRIGAGANARPRLVKVYAGNGGLDGVIAWVQSNSRKNITLVPASSSVNR